MKPILFNAPMVRAILAGNKTQTRRMIKPQPIPNGNGWIYKGAFWRFNEPVDLERIKYYHSIFMPRKAARIFLRVEDVRVERVQDISESDAQAEGVHSIDLFMLSQISSQPLSQKFSYKAAFYELWDSLNAKRWYGWDMNPWVWVYTFASIEEPT
jgi:hypothetical protein